MKTYTYTFNGSGTDTWVLGGGNYFAIVSLTSPVSVQGFDRQNQLMANVTQAGQGDSWSPADATGKPVPFGSIQISSATAQTVSVVVGDGTWKKGELLGSVSISGVPTVALQQNLSTSPIYVDQTGSIVTQFATSTRTYPYNSAFNDSWAAGSQAFYGVALNVPGAGNDAFVGLLNPTGSTFNVIIDSLETAVGTNGIYEAGIGVLAEANIPAGYQTWPVNWTNVALANGGGPSMITLGGTTLPPFIGTHFVPGGANVQPYEWCGKTGFYLAPGYAVIIQPANVTGTDVSMKVQGRILK